MVSYNGGAQLDPAASMIGMKIITFPYWATTDKLNLAAGTLVWVLTHNPILQTISQLGTYVETAGVTSSGVNAMAMYDKTGNLLSKTGDMTAGFSGTGWIFGSLAAAAQLAANTDYYLAILTHFSGTVPQVRSYLAGTIGFNLDPVNSDYLSVFTTTQTDFPATFSPAAATVNSGTYLMAGQ